MFTVRTRETCETTRKQPAKTMKPLTRPYPQDVGYGFQGYGYRLAWDTPGLPMVFPSSGLWILDSEAFWDRSSL